MIVSAEAEAGASSAGQTWDTLAEGLRIASHEIRQPVAAIIALTEATKALPGATPEVRAYLDRIVEQATEVSSTVRSVLDPPQHQPPSHGAVDLDEVVHSVLESFRVTWSGRLVFSGSTGLVVAGDRVRLRRCLVNVVENAARAAGAQGVVAITLCERGPLAEIWVDDDGPGFGSISSGSRIGLPLTRLSLEAMGGGLSVGRSVAWGGARVVLSTRLFSSRPPLRACDPL